MQDSSSRPAHPISIHAPTRGATIVPGQWLHESFGTISIHAPTRGATSAAPGLEIPIYISIHAPTRGATALGWFPCQSWQISIHAPTRGATSAGSVRQQAQEAEISIHAPTRGATPENPVPIVSAGDISIHAPHEGSDSGQQWVCDEIDLFQSTLPRGERRSLHSVSCIVERISIHAPTRGATKTTLQGYNSPGVYPHFNPRSHEGSDAFCCAFCCSSSIFQSTLPRGERRL